MNYTDRLKEGYKPGKMQSYSAMFPRNKNEKQIRTFVVYLKNGICFEIEAINYRYEVQGFSSLSGEWNVDKTVGKIAFGVLVGKTVSYDVHHVVFEDVSAIICKSKLKAKP